MRTTALIILNYNNAEDTLNCVKSILKHNTAPVKIIVVDNASSPAQLNELKTGLDLAFGHQLPCIKVKASDDLSYTLPAATILPPACIVEIDRNLGYGKGNNVALKMAYADAGTDFTMILNNDVIFTEDIVPYLLDEYDDTPGCAIISPLLYKKDRVNYDLDCARNNKTVSQLIADNFLYYVRLALRRPKTSIHPSLYLLTDKANLNARILEIELPSGSCMLLRKDIFKRLGFFDPGTFMYYEENILYSKVRKAGMHNYLSLKHSCIHLGASTTTRMPDNKFLVKSAKDSERYYVRNYSGASRLAVALHAASVKFYMLTYNLSKALKK